MAPTATTPVAPRTFARIALDPSSAATYNPYGSPAASFGDPAKALDGDLRTAWTYELDPSTGGRTRVGLVIYLGSQQPVGAISLAVSTPGIHVEFYGATGAEPVSVTDPAWIHLTSRRRVPAATTLTLKHYPPLDYVLIWITRAPPGVTTGTIGIGEVSLFS